MIICQETEQYGTLEIQAEFPTRFEHRLQIQTIDQYNTWRTLSTPNTLIREGYRSCRRKYAPGLSSLAAQTNESAKVRARCWTGARDNEFNCVGSQEVVLLVLTV